MSVRVLVILSLMFAFGACSGDPEDVAPVEGEDVSAAQDGEAVTDDAGPETTPAGPCDGLTEGDPCDSDGDQCSLEICDAAGICVSTGEFETCAEASAQYPCWTYVCIGKSGCVSTNFIEGLSCDDGVPCTKNDTCTTNDLGQEACIGEPIAVDDGNPCTNDACADGVVTHEPIDGAPCDLEDACSSEGTCLDGACVPSTPCGCEEDADCDDGAGCNGLETCDPEAGCLSGAAVVVDDGVDCTVDACEDPTGEVTHTPDDSLCAPPDKACTQGICGAAGCESVSVADCCGNGALEEGEACDDGNGLAGDGCDGSCNLEGAPVTDDGYVFTQNHAHSALVRLGDDVVVLAYSETETTQELPTQFTLQVLKRTGHHLDLVSTKIFDATITQSNQTQGFELVGALGDNHFFLLVYEPGNSRTFYWMKWDGETVSLLGSEPIVEAVDDASIGGAPNTQEDCGDGVDNDEDGFADCADWDCKNGPGDCPPDKGFFRGHPVDDTRFVWSYRYANSGEPVHYQVISRDGDAYSFGAEMQRPGPEMFPGQDTSVSQAEPQLMRIGPSIFREIRPGYVWNPGNLSSWTLHIDGAQLSYSDIVVHDNSPIKTMQPLVAANGSGGGLVAFQSYGSGSGLGEWSWGSFEEGSYFYTHGGVLFEDTAMYTHGAFDTADAYIGGYYYLRNRWGTVWRFDEQAFTPVEIATDLPYAVCARVPHVLRTGTIGIFLTCSEPVEAGVTAPAELRFMDLLEGCGDGSTAGGESCDDGNNVSGDGCSSACALED